MRARTRRLPVVVLFLFAMLLLPNLAAAQVTPQGASADAPSVDHSVASAVTPPLKDEPRLHQERGPDTKPLKLLPHPNKPGLPDPVVQAAAGPAVSTTPGIGFAGLGNGDYGFSVRAAPPDTNLSVGDTQVVQWVNSSFAVFDKATGALVYGPAAGNTLFQSLGSGSGCAATNDGDPIAQWDKAAHRWVLTQFSVSNPSAYGYLQCVAVSRTPDATQGWNVYAFSYGTTQFNDYPKLGVWPDGYYLSYNIFSNGASFAGSKVCALDRSAMLAGAASATQQCFQLSSAYGGLLPADLDGSNPPPAGSPMPFLAFGSSSLQYWRFHVDWSSPANTKLTGPSIISVAAFSAACGGGGTCIPQPSTTQKLDSLADRLMYRLAYRNFGDHESLVVNHSVTTSGGQVGVRWYELRNAAGSTLGSAAPVVAQQATFAPDSSYRWMGSIAQDAVGDIALGYSVSSSSLYPSIRYTGRLVTDAANTMQGETTLKAGGGYQSYPGGLSRWGDYSSMSVDPTDDCTFWYTTEYLKASGGFNWSTWISSFRFPGCSTTPPAPPAAPSSLSATAISSSQINLGWQDNSSDESGFRIERSSDGVNFGLAATLGAGAVSYSDTGLAASTAYTYRVSAYNSGGSSGYSNTATATTLAPPPAPPNAPSNLTATAVSTSQINLTWKDNSGNEDTFAVERSRDRSTWTQIATVPANTQAYSSTGLSRNTTYYYRVRAISATLGSSAYSNTASARTLKR